MSTLHWCREKKKLLKMNIFIYFPLNNSLIHTICLSLVLWSERRDVPSAHPPKEETTNHGSRTSLQCHPPLATDSSENVQLFLRNNTVPINHSLSRTLQRKKKNNFEF